MQPPPPSTPATKQSTSTGPASTQLHRVGLTLLRRLRPKSSHVDRTKPKLAQRLKSARPETSRPTGKTSKRSVRGSMTVSGSTGKSRSSPRSGFFRSKGGFPRGETTLRFDRIRKMLNLRKKGSRGVSASAPQGERKPSSPSSSKRGLSRLTPRSPSSAQKKSKRLFLPSARKSLRRPSFGPQFPDVEGHLQQMSRRLRRIHTQRMRLQTASALSTRHDKRGPRGRLSTLSEVSTSSARQLVAREGMRKKMQEERSNLELVKAENAQLKKQVRDMIKSSGAHGNRVKLEKLERKVSSHRSKLDALREDRRLVERDIERKRNGLRSLVLDAQPIITKNSSWARQIRHLEEELDRCLIKFNEVVDVGSTYGGILKRLKREQLGFDGQLRCVERTLREKKRDVDELQSRLLQARNMKEASKNELTELLSANQEHLWCMEKELERKTTFVKEKLDVTRRLTQRADFIRQVEALNDETRLRLRLITDRFGQKMDDSRLTGDTRLVQQLERKWRRALELTGATTVDDVCKRFYSSCDTYIGLHAIVKETKVRMDRLVTSRSRLQKTLSSAQYAAGSQRLHTGRLEESYGMSLFKTQESLKKLLHRYEELTKVGSELSAGFEAMNDGILQSLPPSSRPQQQVAPPEEDGSFASTLPRVLRDLEENVGALVKAHAVWKKSSLLIESPRMGFFVTEMDVNLAPPLGAEKNVRVPLRSSRVRNPRRSADLLESGDNSPRSEFSPESSDEEEVSPEVAQDPPDRDQIKLLSKLAVARGRSNRRPQ